MARFQTGVTGVIANRQLIEGSDVHLQVPDVCKEEETDLKVTGHARYEPMEQARTRLLALHQQLEHKLAYKKRTEIVVEMVRPLEEQGQFSPADSAFDNGGLTVELTRGIDSKGKHGVSELESARLILWQEQWRRIADVAIELGQHHPESFRSVAVRCRKGETKQFWTFTKSVRLKRYGRKRIAMGHEAALSLTLPAF
jgi:hypothetical protein